MNRGIKADKSDRAMYKVMADIKIRLGRRDEAMAVLRLGLENTKGTSGYADILWDVVNANIVAGKFDEAEKSIQELRDYRFGQNLSYPPWLVEFAEARLAVTKNDWAAALPILTDVLPKLQKDPGVQKLAYLFLGQCYRSTGRTAKSDRRLLGGREDRSLLDPARVGLAEIYMSRGELRRGRRAIPHADRKAPIPTGGVPLLGADPDHDAPGRRQGKTRLGARGQAARSDRAANGR